MLHTSRDVTHFTWCHILHVMSHTSHDVTHFTWCHTLHMSHTSRVVTHFTWCYTLHVTHFTWCHTLHVMSHTSRDVTHFTWCHTLHMMLHDVIWRPGNAARMCCFSLLLPGQAHIILLQRFLEGVMGTDLRKFFCWDILLVLYFRFRMRVNAAASCVFLIFFHPSLLLILQTSFLCSPSQGLVSPQWVARFTLTQQLP